MEREFLLTVLITFLSGFTLQFFAAWPWRKVSGSASRQKERLHWLALCLCTRERQSRLTGRGSLVEVDPVTDVIMRRIPVSGADENHRLLIDAASHRALVACDGNDQLIVIDLARWSFEDTPSP